MPALRSPVVSAAGALLLAGLLLPGVGASPAGSADAVRLWGADGHRIAARAAARTLPPEVPSFFREAGPRLAWLGPEPDRWKLREFQEMDHAWRYDHYIDLENIPGGSGAEDAAHRYAFLGRLFDAGVRRPERDVGFLPFTMIELQQRLTSLWTRWYEAGSDREREWIEERIVDDAGVLGHYVTDASQPHHTTVHFDGWNASSGASEPNPEGFTEARGFHGRFETGFVSAHVREGSVREAVPREPRNLGTAQGVRRAVWSYIRESHGQVERLYRLEKRVGFDPSRPPAAEARDFAERRLAAGAAMLRDLWWTAYREGRAAAR